MPTLLGDAMLLGITIRPYMLIAGGSFLATLTVLQLLIGYRKIHFKGKTHLKVHKAVAWIMLAGLIIHGSLALAFFAGL